MKRALLTLFLFFYAFSVVGLTVQRTGEWANERADNLKHHHLPHHGARIGEAHKHAPHQVQTKLHEDGSILITFGPTSEPPQVETELHHRFIRFAADRNSHWVSSRAPPRFV